MCSWKIRKLFHQQSWNVIGNARLSSKEHKSSNINIGWLSINIVEKHLRWITNHEINMSQQWSAITERKCRTNSYFPDALNEVWCVQLGRNFYLHCDFNRVKHPLSLTKSETNAICFEEIFKKIRLFSINWRRELLFLRIKNAAILHF